MNYESVFNLNEVCECCLKDFKPTKTKFRVGKHLKEIIQSFLEIKIQDSQSCICFDCNKKLLNFKEFKCEIQEKHKVFRKKNFEVLKIKEEPQSEIAEFLIVTNPLLDPFANVDEIKEELFKNESKYEPEVKIYEENFNFNEPMILLKQSPTALDISFSHRSSSYESNPGHSTKYFCEICSKTCFSKKSLLEHLQRHFPNDCKKLSKSNETVLNGKQSKALVDSFICHHCRKVFKTRIEMKQCRDSHSLRKKDSVEITKPCPVCQKTMKSNSIYSHIRLVHNKERDQICQICGKTLKTSYDLKVHLRKHSGERPEICETCGKTFISYAQLYKHRKVRHMTRENYQCSFCLKNLLSRFKLKCHMERFHPNGFDNGMRVNEETNCYHCKICPLKFIAMHKYEKHLKQNDCHKYEGLTPDEILKDIKGEFKCQECGSVLNTLKGLKKHIRFVHPKEPQTCKICFKKLKNPHTLWQHMTLSHKQPVKKRKL